MKKMKKMKEINILALLTAIATGCASYLDPHMLCNEDGKCSTAWHNEHGDVVTSSHVFDDRDVLKAHISASYEPGFITQKTLISDDIVAYKEGSQHPKICYTKAIQGDVVAVQTHTNTHILEVYNKIDNGYSIIGWLEDTCIGSPVTKRGCVIGIVTSINRDGMIIVSELKK